VGDKRIEMPMYFPDLESVKKLAESMKGNDGEKQYKGIIPETEEKVNLLSLFYLL
jgi:hypothetical protein